MDVLENYVKVYEGSCSWFQASASCDYHECEGAQNLSWKQHGFKSIIDLTLKPDPNLDVEFNKEATKITWNLRPSVSRLDGTIYEADHVFSPSLGFLKSRHSTMFEPGLPEEKIKAIEDAAFGKVVKVLLQFEEPWWPPGDAFEGFSCVWLDNDKEKLLQEFPHGPNKIGRSWLLDLACTMKVTGNPNILMLWFAGSAVCEIEEMPEETFLDGIVYLFEKYLGDKLEVPRPKRLLRTTWNTNPHYKGTYSFQTTESRKNNSQETAVLAEPLFIEEVPRVLFCGEATHSSYFSTVHGAIESGRREAQRIIVMHGVE